MDISLARNKPFEREHFPTYIDVYLEAVSCKQMVLVSCRPALAQHPTITKFKIQISTGWRTGKLTTYKCWVDIGPKLSSIAPLLSQYWMLTGIAPPPSLIAQHPWRWGCVANAAAGDVLSIGHGCADGSRGRFQAC